MSVGFPVRRASSVSFGLSTVRHFSSSALMGPSTPPASRMTGTPAACAMDATSRLMDSGISRCSRMAPAERIQIQNSNSGSRLEVQTASARVLQGARHFWYAWFSGIWPAPRKASPEFGFKPFSVRFHETLPFPHIHATGLAVGCSFRTATSFQTRQMLQSHPLNQSSSLVCSILVLLSHR